METHHSLLRGCEHPKDTARSSSKKRGEGKLFPGTKQEHQPGPIKGEAKHCTQTRVRVSASSSSKRSPLSVLGHGNWRGGVLQSSAWLSTNGCLPWQQALQRLCACSDGTPLSGDISGFFPSLCGRRLLMECILGGGGVWREAQSSPFSLLSGSPYFPVFFLQEIQIKGQWM